MSYIKRKRSYHPLLVVLFVLINVFAVGFAFSVLKFNTGIKFSFILAARYPEGINTPVYLIVVLFASALVASALLMYEILVKRLEQSRKLIFHFFVIPLIVLTSHSIVEAMVFIFFIAVSALTLFNVLSMAAFESEIKKVFLSGFLGGLLFLITSASAMLLLIFPFLLFANRIFSVRAVLIYGFAFIIPLGYVLSYFYLTDYNSWDTIVNPEANSIHLYKQLFELVNIYVLGFIGLLLIVVVVRVHIKLSEFKIAIRRAYTSMLFFILLFTAAIILMPEVYSATYLSVLMFIALFYYIRLITDIKRKVLQALFYVLPALIYGLNYFLLQ